MGALHVRPPSPGSRPEVASFKRLRAAVDSDHARPQPSSIRCTFGLFCLRVSSVPHGTRRTRSQQRTHGPRSPRRADRRRFSAMILRFAHLLASSACPSALFSLCEARCGFKILALEVGSPVRPALTASSALYKRRGTTARSPRSRPSSSLRYAGSSRACTHACSSSSSAGISVSGTELPPVLPKPVLDRAQRRGAFRWTECGVLPPPRRKLAGFSRVLLPGARSVPLALSTANGLRRGDRLRPRSAALRPATQDQRDLRAPRGRAASSRTVLPPCLPSSACFLERLARARRADGSPRGKRSRSCTSPGLSTWAALITRVAGSLAGHLATEPPGPRRRATAPSSSQDPRLLCTTRSRGSFTTPRNSSHLAVQAPP